MWAFPFVPKVRTKADSSKEFMAPLNNNRPALPRAAHRLPFNVDLLAVGIALTLAALIRFNVIHQISF
jgi:hypothetical protein